MNLTTTKSNRYNVSIKGEGGELSFIPMSTEQVAFWTEKGDEALAEHLFGGWEEDATPPEYELGNFYDIGDCASGVDLQFEPELTVTDEGGVACFEKALTECDLGGLVKIDRWVIAPPMGAFFRTYEKGSQTYVFETDGPFDPSKLCFIATETPDGVFLSTMEYDGQEISPETTLDQSWSNNVAEIVCINR